MFKYFNTCLEKESVVEINIISVITDKIIGATFNVSKYFIKPVTFCFCSHPPLRTLHTTSINCRFIQSKQSSFKKRIKYPVFQKHRHAKAGVLFQNLVWWYFSSSHHVSALISHLILKMQLFRLSQRISEKESVKSKMCIKCFFYSWLLSYRSLISTRNAVNQSDGD